MKVTLYIAASVDGFIATPDGGVAWLDPFNGTGEDYGYAEFLKTVDTLVMGSKTYEQSLTFGAWAYPRKRSVVMTTRALKKPEEAEVEFYSGKVTSLVQRLKDEGADHVWLVGGAALVQEFLQEDLVDELMLFEVPIILGEGISLFGDLKKKITMKLLKTRSYKSGITLLHYLL